MKKVKKESRKVSVLKDIICDICKKSCKVLPFKDKEHFNYEYVELKTRWGYGSTHDGETWTAQVCNKCVDAKLTGLINFRKEDYDWQSGRTYTEDIRMIEDYDNQIGEEL